MFVVLLIIILSYSYDIPVVAKRQLNLHRKTMIAHNTTKHKYCFLNTNANMTSSYSFFTFVCIFLFLFVHVSESLSINETTFKPMEELKKMKRVNAHLKKINKPSLKTIQVDFFQSFLYVDFSLFFLRVLTICQFGFLLFHLETEF